MGYFVAWAVAGAGLAMSIAGAFTIGLFVLVPTVVWIGVLVTRPGARGPAVFGALTGPAFVAFWIGWLNRDGPGDVCTSSPTESSCSEEWSPWPFAAVGVVLLIVAVLLYVRARRRGNSAAARSQIST